MYTAEDFARAKKGFHARLYVVGALLAVTIACLCVALTLRLRLFVSLFRRMGTGQVRAETLFGLDAACMASRTVKQFWFPGGISVRSDGKGLLVWTGPRKA